MWRHQHLILKFEMRTICSPRITSRTESGQVGPCLTDAAHATALDEPLVSPLRRRPNEYYGDDRGTYARWRHASPPGWVAILFCRLTERPAQLRLAQRTEKSRPAPAAARPNITAVDGLSERKPINRPDGFRKSSTHPANPHVIFRGIAPRKSLLPISTPQWRRIA
jgi:hypothetical protein